MFASSLELRVELFFIIFSIFLFDIKILSGKGFSEFAQNMN